MHRTQIKISDTKASNKLQLHVHLNNVMCTLFKEYWVLHIGNSHLNRWSTSDSLCSPSIAFVRIVKCISQAISFIFAICFCFVLFTFHMIFYCFCIDELKQKTHEETGMEMRMNDGYAQCSQQPISSIQNKQTKQLWKEKLKCHQVKSIQGNNENEEKKRRNQHETNTCITYQEVSPFNSRLKKRAKISDKFQRFRWVYHIYFIFNYHRQCARYGRALSTNFDDSPSVAKFYTPATLHFMRKMNHFIYSCVYKKKRVKDFREITEKPQPNIIKHRSIATKQVHWKASLVVWTIWKIYILYRATMSTFRQI